eukprot:scaffold4587_cov182-Amphora_coffeaeformis.AAC.6
MSTTTKTWPRTATIDAVVGQRLPFPPFPTLVLGVPSIRNKNGKAKEDRNVVGVCCVMGFSLALVVRYSRPVTGQAFMQCNDVLEQLGL